MIIHLLSPHRERGPDIFATARWRRTISVSVTVRREDGLGRRSHCLPVRLQPAVYLGRSLYRQSHKHAFPKYMLVDFWGSTSRKREAKRKNDKREEIEKRERPEGRSLGAHVSPTATNGSAINQPARGRSDTLSRVRSAAHRTKAQIFHLKDPANTVRFTKIAHATLVNILTDVAHIFAPHCGLQRCCRRAISHSVGNITLYHYT